MAKILVSISGNKLSPKEDYKIFPFYEGLMIALKRNGNDVHYMIINDYVASYTSRSNKTSSAIDMARMDEQIAKINPDLVIAFNNAAYENLKNLDCPYIVWGVDPISVYAEKDELKSNVGRYIFATNCHDDYVSVRGYFNSDRVEILPFATDVYKRDDITQDIPISFVGSLWDGEVKALLEKGISGADVARVVAALRADTQLSLDELCAATGIHHSALKEATTFRLLHGIAASDRAKVLTGLTDMGLEVYGLTNNWTALANNNLDLALSYNSKVIYTLKDIEELYNRSKICFNMSHIHARGDGFSFRVIDSMASNGCLVTDYKEGYHKLFGKYVDLPTFEYGNVADAHRVCRRVLEDDAYRQEIIQGSQKAIDAEYRFEHRFVQMEQVTGVKLLHSGAGTVTRIEPLYRKEKKDKNVVSVPVTFKKAKKRSASYVVEKVFTFLFKRKKNYLRKQFKKLDEKIECGFKKIAHKGAQTGSLNVDAYLARVSRPLAVTKNATDKIHVLFLFQEASYWDSLKTVYETLKADPKFEVTVLAIPLYQLPDMSGPYLADHQISFLQKSGIEYIDARLIHSLLLDPHTLRPDYVFTQIHFDAQRPFQYRTDVMRLYTKVCLVPHAFLLSDSDNMELSHQSDYFKVFATGESHAETLKKVFHHDRNIAITGWPRFDSYREAVGQDDMWKISRQDNPSVKRLIWSPHWWMYGHTNEIFKSADSIWVYLYTLLRNNPSIEVIIKPHPNFLRGLVAGGYMSQDELDARVEAFNALPNGSIYRGGNYFDLFRTSDGMINNSTSFLAEYLPTGNPMLYVDCDRKFQLNALANEMIDHYYKGVSIADIESFVNQVVIAGQDSMKEKRQKLLDTLALVGTHDAASRIKDVLIQSVNDPY